MDSIQRRAKNNSDTKKYIKGDIKMKKDLIFAPIMLLFGVLLFLLRLTGMPVHIMLSVAGILVLASYTILTKKDWKIPALEIGMRAMYGLALISGVVIKINYIIALSIIHKLFAALFVLALIALFVYKLITENKGKEENNG